MMIDTLVILQMLSNPDTLVYKHEEGRIEL